MSQFYNDAIYWIEIDRIHPNPFQPRREFDKEKLEDLAESIRQYGVLQPLTVTRKEEVTEEGLTALYELIAGERRLRAAKLAGLNQVPALIREAEEDERIKLELAIIENLQREDLNPIDRARAFHRLVSEFGFKHIEIAQKIGKSREYVTNTIRVLTLPEGIQNAVVEGKINEGHTRPLMMLRDRPQEQETLFRDIVLKKTSVRMVEQLARRIAQDRIRKHDKSPEMMELEKSLTETLGTRVLIENRANGGRLLIEFFSPEDLTNIAALLAERQDSEAGKALKDAEVIYGDEPAMRIHPHTTQLPKTEAAPKTTEPEEDLYSVRSFTV